MPTTREVDAKKAERIRRQDAERAAAQPDTDEPAKPASKETPPEWSFADLVVCEDGPRTGEWALLSEGPSSWTELRRLAVVNGETEETGRTLGYIPTDDWQTHRAWAHTRGRVLIWAPHLAAQAASKHEARRATTNPTDPGGTR